MSPAAPISLAASAWLAMMGTTQNFETSTGPKMARLLLIVVHPTAAPELVLALLDADFDALCHAGHDLHVVPAETQLLGY